MSAVTEMTDEELCSAGGRLQKAHDYIEMKGFNIDWYNPVGGHACCYIGSVKVCAGEDGEPRRGGAAELALRILDDLAAPTYKARAAKDNRYVGRAIEVSRLFRPSFKKLEKREQAEKVLPVFRQAIREVQTEMERRA